MNPLERLRSIESRLNSCVISVDDACAELFTGPKPWTTTWWKVERARLIGSECSTCRSTEPPMVLQHTWQPIGWKDALRQVGPPNWDWWKECHPLPSLDWNKEILIKRPVCPVCGSIRVRPRVRTRDWTCHAGQCGTQEERHDNWAFPEPLYEMRPDLKAIANHKRTLRAEWESLVQQSWEEWLKSPESAINRRNAIKLCISESKRYLSFEDTKTLCKRCAGREDYHYILKSEREAVQRRLLLMAACDLSPKNWSSCDFGPDIPFP